MSELDMLIAEQVADQKAFVLFPQVITPKQPRLYKRNRKLRDVRTKVVKDCVDKGLSFAETAVLLNISAKHVQRIYDDNNNLFNVSTADIYKETYED